MSLWRDRLPPLVFRRLAQDRRLVEQTIKNSSSSNELLRIPATARMSVATPDGRLLFLFFLLLEEEAEKCMAERSYEQHIFMPHILLPLFLLFVRPAQKQDNT